MEYAKTKDILHVMNMLGHKNIKNTLIYMQFVKFESDEYICKVAKTPKEVSELIEVGFEYVCEQDGLKFFPEKEVKCRWFMQWCRGPDLNRRQPGLQPGALPG